LREAFDEGFICDVGFSLDASGLDAYKFLGYFLAQLCLPDDNVFVDAA